MDTCPLCPNRLESTAEQTMQACGECAGKLGIIPIPAARRPRVPCKQCNGMRFLHAVPREHSTTHGGDYNEQVSAPMYVTYPVSAKRTFFTDKLDGAAEVLIEHGKGLLEVYVCTKCGLVEWYCHDISSIPIHPHQMTEVIDYTNESPYR